MRRALAALVLAVALPLPGLADLVVQPGETLSEIAERNGVGLQQLMRANGIENPKLVQAGQRLVLPGGATAPSGRSRSGRANGGPTGGAKTGTVLVQPGETLSEIAERNGVGLQQLMRANGIENPKLVQAGQRLVLPGGATAPSGRSRDGRANGGPNNGPKTGTVVVLPGETLSEIAERNGVGLQQLMRVNGIENPKLVQAGQRLALPGGATAPSGGSRDGRSRDGGEATHGGSGRSFSYTVKEGETLSEIAERYDTTVNRLMQRNSIGDPSQLQAGRQLLIPGTQVTASSSTTRASTAKPAGQAYNPKAKEHVVQSGESLSQIAEGYKMPLDQLVVINNISNRDLVLSGTRLKLTAPPPVSPAKPSIPVKPNSIASQVSSKPAPAKPAAPNASPKATTAATAAQSFPAAPTSKPRLTPNPGATSPTAGPTSPSAALNANKTPAKNSQVQINQPTSSPVAINTDGGAISGKPTTGKPTTAKTSPVPMAAAGQSAATTAATTGTATATGTAPATKAPTASKGATTTAASMASSGATPGNSANPKPEKSSPITANPAARSSSTSSGSVLNNSATNTAAANASARGAASKVGGQSSSSSAGSAPAAAATTAKIATTDSSAATGINGAVSSRAQGSSKLLDSAKTAKNIGPDWRTYGPISVDWANWQSLGGSYVAPSLNGEGQPLYTAINCGARKLNSTSQSGQWKTWEGPRSDAEQQLVSDLCKAKGS